MTKLFIINLHDTYRVSQFSCLCHQTVLIIWASYPRLSSSALLVFRVRCFSSQFVTNAFIFAIFVNINQVTEWPDFGFRSFAWDWIVISVFFRQYLFTPCVFSRFIWNYEYKYHWLLTNISLRAHFTCFTINSKISTRFYISSYPASSALHISLILIVQHLTNHLAWNSLLLYLRYEMQVFEALIWLHWMHYKNLSLNLYTYWQLCCVIVSLHRIY